jgi:hypothetical protein
MARQQEKPKDNLFLVLGLIALVILLTIGMFVLSKVIQPKVVGEYSGQYYNADGTQMPITGEIHEGETVGCPTSIDVEVGRATTGRTGMKKWDTFYLIDGSCQAWLN